MKTYSTNISYLFNRQQWSFDLQSSQCQDTVQLEGATTNQMQIKLYAESYDNKYIYITFILNRININNIQLSFWNTKLCIQSKMKKISTSVTIKAWRRKKKSVTSISNVLFFLFHCGMFFFFVEIYHLFGWIYCASKLTEALMWWGTLALKSHHYQGSSASEKLYFD